MFELNRSEDRMITELPVVSVEVGNLAVDF